MQPVFLDFHIHTSSNPDSLNESYDIDILKEKVEKVAQGSDYLISFSDHNTINKAVYLEAVEKIENLLVGVELHIRNYEKAKPYHCHILFDLKEIDGSVIDDLNLKLDKLYPKKVVSNEDQIPRIQDIPHPLNSCNDFTIFS